MKIIDPSEEFMDGKPTKIYNERLEIKVRKFVQEHVEPGREAEELILEILDIIENESRRKEN